MTDSEQTRFIDTDIMIGNLLHQTEAVIDIDEESLAQRKQELLDWMTQGTPHTNGDRERPEGEALLGGVWPAGQRPLNEVTFLTVAEVASIMRVAKSTVYRLVHSGYLPAIRVGRSFRVPAQAVHNYLRESYTGQINSIDQS